MRRFARGLAALALAASASGCGDGSMSGLELTTGLTEEQFMQMVPTYWEALQAAPWTTRFRGVRSVEFTIVGPDLAEVKVRYKERVSCDGTGQFNLEPLQAETPVFPDEATFLLLQQSRQAFYYRYRDFAVRDADTLIENFKLIGLKPVTILGRACQEAQLLRSIEGGHHYEVAFDVATGLPLRYTEYDDNGNPVARMEFESIEFAPSLESVAFSTPGNQEVPIGLDESGFEVLGFEPRLPAFVPAGFTLLEKAKVEDSFGRRWLKLGYTDGVEMLFFLHRLAAGDLSLPSSFRSGRTQDEPSEVLVYGAGPLTVAQGVVGTDEFIVAGEVDEDLLLRMIDSALE